MDLRGVTLVVLAGAAVLVLLLAALLLTTRDGTGPEPGTYPPEAAELAAHAENVRVTATRAATLAVRARERATAAERERDAAWQAQEAAENRYEDAWQAASAAREAAALHAEETDPERGRMVAQAALAAYRRGDISVEQLREVWRQAEEPDPVQRRLRDEVERHRLLRAAARRGYDRAAAAAHHAQEAARLAEIAANALVEEAATSAIEAEQARLATPRRRHWSWSAPRRPPRH